MMRQQQIGVPLSVRRLTHFPHVIEGGIYFWDVSLSVRIENVKYEEREKRYLTVRQYLQGNNQVIPLEVTHEKLKRPTECLSWCPGCTKKLEEPHRHEKWMKEVVKAILDQVLHSSEAFIKTLVSQQSGNTNGERVLLGVKVRVFRPKKSNQIQGAETHQCNVSLYLANRYRSNDGIYLHLMISKHDREGVTLARNILLSHAKPRNGSENILTQRGKALLDSAGNPIWNDGQLCVNLYQDNYDIGIIQITPDKTG